MNNSTTQRQIEWPETTIPPLNLWNIWPSQEMLQLHFQINKEMLEEQHQLTKEIKDIKECKQ